ncbi:MAG: hypothetical protein QXE66_00375 [Desulfurococcaceae archaeon]
MEQLHSILSGLALKLGRVALGISAIFAWTYAISLVLPSCPTQEGGIIARLVTIPLGSAGVIAWGLLLTVAAWRIENSRIWFILAAAAAVFSSLLIGEPTLLAILSALLLVLSYIESSRACAETLALGVMVVEALTLIYLLVRAYGVKLPVPAAFPLHLSLYCIFTPLAPLVALAPSLSPLVSFMYRKRVEVEGGIKGKWALAFGLIISCLLWIVLYASEVNRAAKLIGVDSNTRYYPHALQLLAEGFPSILRVGYDRPLYYFLLYWLARSLGPHYAVRILPLAALVLYTVASYLTAKELMGERTAGLASLTAPLTYTVTAGLYGGLYANWTALSAALLAVTSAARWLKQGKWVWLVTYLGLLIVTAVTHVYMGAVFFTSTFVSMTLCSLPKECRRRALVALVAQLTLAALGFYAADSFAHALNFRPPSHVVSSLMRSWLNRVQKLQLFSPAWWRDYGYAIYNYAATAALDPTIWMFTFAGILVVGSHKLSGFLLIPWLIIVYILSFTAPFELMWRALYNFPFSISEAIGIATLLTIIKSKVGRETTLLWLTAILLFKLNYTLAFAIGLAS